MTRKIMALVMALSLGLAACAAMLGIKAKSPERAFVHRAHSIRGITCLQCHAGMASAGDTGPLHVPSTDTCVQCHAKPHDSHACSSCHGSELTRARATLARTHLKFSHERHVPKVGGQCVPCHDAAGDVSQEQLRPPMAQCFTCHAHKDQWRSTQCESCHVDLPAESVKPASHVIHEGDFLREHGVRAAAGRDLCASCHEEPFCASCHGVTVPTLPWRLAFDRPTLTGLHRAGFRNRHADEARAAPGTCTSCHSAEKFCLDCHTKERSTAARLGENPHPPNWVRAQGGEHGRAARMDPLACASCHGGEGEALCVGCHHVGGPGGNPHGPGFSSAKDRGRDQPCRQCHGS